MSHLKLKIRFKDESGAENDLDVHKELFTIGRHSACDLTVADSRLSREHARIEADAGGFTLTDLGSSNGTTINGQKISGMARLKDGDVVDLGGGLRLSVEIASVDDQEANQPPAHTQETGMADVGNVGAVMPSASQPEPSSGIPTSLFFIAPILGLFVLMVLIGGFALMGGSGGSKNTTESDLPADDGDEPINVERDRTDADRTPEISSEGPATPRPSATIENSPQTSPTESSETAKVEKYGAQFLRSIAQNEPKAFLTSDQADKVNTKLKQLGRSSAISANINSARKSAGAIRSLAESRNFKPQFLAAAAITKLGSNSGDVLATAQSVVDVYDKLRIQINDEFSDDVLLMVAAYEQGAAGDTMKMRNMLQNLARTSKEGAKTIRTIWYLEKNGKITSQEYDRALTFLAVGTIAQNPSEFNVKAEALKF